MESQGILISMQRVGIGIGFVIVCALEVEEEIIFVPMVSHRAYKNVWAVSRESKRSGKTVNYKIKV